VKITGATSVILKIKNIPTEKKIIRNINSDIVIDVSLSDSLINLVKVEPKSVKISYKIELAAEKSFEDLKVDIKNMPADKEVLLIPPNLNLSLRGGVDMLSKLSVSDFNIYINYELIEKDTLGSVAPIIEIPENLSIINYSPQKFQYIIKKKN
jgi:hypothetical protein